MKTSATRRRDMARRAIALFIPILIAAVCCSACSPNAAETEKTPVAGTWKATALVADAGKQSEKIVPIDSVEQLASLYDGFVLTLGEDGTFDYLQSPLVCRGRYSRDDDAREDRYILETETTEFGSKVTRAEKGSGKLYQAELLGDGTLRVSAYDRILRSPDHREFPIIFSRDQDASVPNSEDIPHLDFSETDKQGPTDATPAKPSPEPHGEYSKVLDEYTRLIESRAPVLASEYLSESEGLSDIQALAELSNEKVAELAEITNDGISEMARIMQENEDSYETYESWAQRLQDVYMREADLIMDAYMESAM